MKKVIVFGHDPVFDAFPDNFIKGAAWTGDANDRTLENAIDFFEGNRAYFLKIIYAHFCYFS
jgi:hypothetical protein